MFWLRKLCPKSAKNFGRKQQFLTSSKSSDGSDSNAFRMPQGRLYTKSNSMVVHFVSDRSVNSGGFKIVITATYGGYIYNKFFTSRLGGEISEGVSKISQTVWRVSGEKQGCGGKLKASGDWKSLKPPLDAQGIQRPFAEIYVQGVKSDFQANTSITCTAVGTSSAPSGQCWSWNSSAWTRRICCSRRASLLILAHDALTLLRYTQRVYVVRMDCNQ